MDRLTAMRVFSEVVERGSFSAAAERLELSRAMVTRHVAALEQWLDVRLMQRTTRRLSLTDAGEQCLRRCRQVLELADELEADVAQQAGELRGELRITCAASFGQAHLARETGVAFLACGHHATESYGAPAVGEHLAARFGLAHRFIEIDNPA